VLRASPAARSDKRKGLAGPGSGGIAGRTNIDVAAAVRADVYEVIVREIPELRDDKPVLALLASSVASNVDTCLQIMQHRIELT